MLTVNPRFHVRQVPQINWLVFVDGDNSSWEVLSVDELLESASVIADVFGDLIDGLEVPIDFVPRNRPTSETQNEIEDLTKESSTDVIRVVLQLFMGSFA